MQNLNTNNFSIFHKTHYKKEETKKELYKDLEKRLKEIDEMEFIFDVYEDLKKYANSGDTIYIPKKTLKDGRVKIVVIGNEDKDKDWKLIYLILGSKDIKSKIAVKKSVEAAKRLGLFYTQNPELKKESKEINLNETSDVNFDMSELSKKEQEIWKLAGISKVVKGSYEKILTSLINTLSNPAFNSDAS